MKGGIPGETGVNLWKGADADNRIVALPIFGLGANIGTWAFLLGNGFDGFVPRTFVKYLVSFDFDDFHGAVFVMDASHGFVVTHHRLGDDAALRVRLQC